MISSPQLKCQRTSNFQSGPPAVTPGNAIINRTSDTATITPCATVGSVPAGYTAQTFTITTSAPANPSNVELAQGAQLRNWTTGAIPSGGSECASGADIFTVQTTSTNPNGGTLTYQIFGQESATVTFKNTSQVITVR